MGLVLGSFLAPETNIIFGDGVGASLVSINCPVLCLLDGESDSGSCPAVGNAFTAHQGNFFSKGKQQLPTGLYSTMRDLQYEIQQR
jgi:hypothetical protein